jgi:nitrite reductase/ring-hydroxylating ferredoxin subunit
VTEKIRAALAGELRELEPLGVEHRGVPYCVIKTGDEVKAFVGICSHKDLAIYPPEMKKGCLICPHHKVTFDPATGGVVDDRGKKVAQGLPEVTVEIVDGVVYLEARKRHRKMFPKKEREWVEKKCRKMGQGHSHVEDV